MSTKAYRTVTSLNLPRTIPALTLVQGQISSCPFFKFSVELKTEFGMRNVLIQDDTPFSAGS